MKSFKKVSKLVLAGGIAMSGLSMMPLITGAESVLTKQTAQTISHQAPYTAIFTEASHNKTFSIKKGETFAIQLQEIGGPYPGAPYWILDLVNKNVSLVADYTQNVDPGSDETGPIAGGPGSAKKMYVFQATSAGATKIQVRQQSHWDGHTDTSEPIFWVTVKVID